MMGHSKMGSRVHQAGRLARWPRLAGLQQCMHARTTRQVTLIQPPPPHVPEDPTNMLVVVTDAASS